MTYVSQNYIAGIKEGRDVFNWAKRDGFATREWLEEQVEQLVRLRRKLARLSSSTIFAELEFFDGEIAFYRNALKHGGLSWSC